jgi:hypothetical protein
MQYDLFKMTSDESEQAMLKYLRVPNRRDYENQKQQANEEVYMFKKKYHQVNILCESKPNKKISNFFKHSTDCYELLFVAKRPAIQTQVHVIRASVGADARLKIVLQNGCRRFQLIRNHQRLLE